jgi:glycosyltransferase involved in cell wall biosynthesis
VSKAELWVVGRPRMALGPVPAGVRLVPEFVPDAQLPAYFGRADIVVLPYSRTERLDFSGVLATALAFGKPIVLSDVGGFSEVASLGAARLVPPDDAAALRSALVGLLGDADARDALAHAAREAARGPYSWDTAAHATLELYRSLV